ncbi:putative Amastin surface glycoprotein [Leishmania shawi]|uniref:Amastin surface glycoprotein n=1 Tax=Leishmania shawi TaxID=5680 RepID=A0AAW3BP42_9TRYP
MSALHPLIGAIISMALQFLVFLFVLVAIPISQFESVLGPGCFTFFGFKSHCSSLSVDTTGTAAFGCAQRRNNMNGGAVFAIISLFTTLAALVLAVMLLLRIPCMTPFALLFAGLSVFTILISWACVAGAFTIKMCGDRWSNFAMKYGPGFGLMVTAWCLFRLPTWWCSASFPSAKGRNKTCGATSDRTGSPRAGARAQGERETR